MKYIIVGLYFWVIFGTFWVVFSRRNRVTLYFGVWVAKWFGFKPKIPIWVNFAGSCNRKSWYILCPFGQFYCYCKNVRAIWLFLGRMVYFSPFWYFVPRKIWQPFSLLCVVPSIPVEINIHVIGTFRIGKVHELKFEMTLGYSKTWCW
jgi:hypothetical protein